MKESAFVNPPWLLEREEAGYIQVTELLYRIAEHCDGNNSVEDIAEKITAAGKPVNPATVQNLIARLLIPRGLVEMGDGSVVPVATGGMSPLALNMRMKMIGPETIMPVTRFLRAVYWPPVLVAVLIAAAIAEVWVYFVHGVAAGLHDAFYTPSLMLIVLLVVIVSAAFHELGHAAALHYAGGRIKGMGAGMYVVYPAFFTDVSDNYRLPRWSRVRTDLGGFYFNLIFALAILGAFLLSGQEFLLLMVLMINLEIIHQLLPFLRLDGYWALADITGVPDFFSQMQAFVRSVLPIKGMEGRKLPELKWWGKLVFGLYILITIPLLCFLLLIMIRSVPRVFATAWDSLGQQAQAFTAAQAQVDVLGMLGAAGQSLLLLIPTVGLCYTLFSLGRKLTMFLWHWGEASAARRALSCVALLAVAGALVLMWWPRNPPPGVPAPPAPLAALSQTNWEPIAADESGTLPNAVAGVVATREPTTVTSSETPEPSQATPVATAAVPASDAQAGGTPVATIVPTAVPTSNAQPAATSAAVAVTPTVTSRAPTPTPVR